MKKLELEQIEKSTEEGEIKYREIKIKQGDAKRK